MTSQRKCMCNYLVLVQQRQVLSTHELVELCFGYETNTINGCIGCCQSNKPCTVKFTVVYPMLQSCRSVLAYDTRAWKPPWNPDRSDRSTSSCQTNCCDLKAVSAISSNRKRNIARKVATLIHKNHWSQSYRATTRTRCSFGQHEEYLLWSDFANHPRTKVARCQGMIFQYRCMSQSYKHQTSSLPSSPPMVLCAKSMPSI